MTSWCIIFCTSYLYTSMALQSETRKLRVCNRNLRRKQFIHLSIPQQSKSVVVGACVRGSRTTTIKTTFVFLFPLTTCLWGNKHTHIIIPCNKKLETLLQFTKAKGCTHYSFMKGAHTQIWKPGYEDESNRKHASCFWYHIRNKKEWQM